VKRALSILLTTILIVGYHPAFAFDSNSNSEDFNLKIEELNNSVSATMRLEILRTGSTEVSWNYPNRPIFKAESPDTNQKALNDYALAIELLIKNLLAKFSSLPTINGGSKSSPIEQSLSEVQFTQNLSSYSKDYIESSKNLILKKALNAKYQNYYGYKRILTYPELPKFTGDYKLDTASLSAYRNNIFAAMKSLEETFELKLIVTSSILDNKESYSKDSFEGLLIRLTELGGIYGMKFQSELDKRNFTCKENHSCVYNYSSPKPSGGLYSFDPGSPDERDKEFNNQERLFQIWLETEIKSISLTRYTQTPYSDEVKANNCRSQTDATKKNLNYFQSTFNAIRGLILQQNSNPDAKERDTEFRDYLTSFSKIEIALSIWQEKLPIYYKRDSNCTEYQELLQQTNYLVQEKKELVLLLKAGKNIKSPASNLVFDQKQYDAQAKKVDGALKTIISSTPKKTIVCISGNTSKKVTGLSPMCPAGYKKK